MIKQLIAKNVKTVNLEPKRVLLKSAFAMMDIMMMEQMNNANHAIILGYYIKLIF